MFNFGAPGQRSFSQDLAVFNDPSVEVKTFKPLAAG
jgi:hypothetical protein